MNSYAAVQPRSERVCMSLRLGRLCISRANVGSSFILMTYIVVEELNK